MHLPRFARAIRNVPPTRQKLDILVCFSIHFQPMLSLQKNSIRAQSSNNLIPLTNAPQQDKNWTF